ncbi:10710_t:CDS:1, partial [Cetraspora pellucida]
DLNVFYFKNTQGESKEIKLETQTEPMEMDNQEQPFQAQIEIPPK